MPTVDAVITEFEARVGKYEADLKRAARTFDQATGAQQKRMQQFERQMRTSSAQISSTLKSLAGTFAAAFSVRQLAGLADSFTRLQNNLRVAGLEGESLSRVQDNLLGISQRYGVELESLSNVFLKASLVQKDLGASTEQIIRLNEITAAALKVTGSSAAEAQGALLQLGQALGSGVVRAEEFNSILEGALPLAQAAARGIDGFGGSVAKLRAAIADGQITSQQFFQGVLRGGVQTLADAEKATLTLSGGVTALTSALTVYFGEAEKANGVSAALGAALGTLAENIDTVIEALATIAAFMGVKYVAGVARAVAANGALSASLAGTAGAMGLTGAAAFALQARLVGAATTMEALAFAARGAGASLLAVFGGPVGAALIAVAAGIYLVHQRTSQLDEATGRYKAGLEASNAVTNKATELSDRLATARGKERAATLEALRIERARAQQALISAKNDIVAARAALARAEAVRAEQSQREGFGRGIGGMGMDPGGISTTIAGIPARQGRANLAAAEQSAKNIEAGLERISAIIEGASSGVAIPAAGDDKPNKPDKPREPTGRTADEITERFVDDLARLQAEELSAQADAARNAYDRADLEAELLALEASERHRLLELEIAQAKQDAEESERLSQAEKAQTIAFLEEQRAAQAAIIDRLYGVESRIDENGEIIVTPNQGLYPAEVRRELEERLADQARDMLRMEQDALEARADIAIDLDERHRLENEAVALAQEIQRSLLEQAIANGEIADADRARALLAQQQAAQRENISRSQMSPLEQFQFDLQERSANLNNALEELGLDVLDTFNSKLIEAIVNFRSLGDVGLAALQSLTTGLLELALQQIQMRVIGALLGKTATAATATEAAAAAAAWAPAAALASLATLGANAGPAAAALASTTALSAALAATSGIAGARRLGGPVRKGETYLVGEAGEELFTPDRNGYIIPNDKLTLPNGARPSQGAGLFGMDPAFGRELRGVIGEAVRAMPPINLYPTLDPGNVLRAALNTPGGRKAMFAFVNENSGKFRSNLE